MGKWLLTYFSKVPYQVAWELQREIVEAKAHGSLSDDVLLVLEHDPVFTLGRRGNRSHIHVSEAFLKEKGIPVFHVERGGDVTYHGPGQLVAYPIVGLRGEGLRVVDFVYLLEEVMIRVAADFDITACRNPMNRGVWVGARKLGSIGIALRHGITFHGLALNVNLSLEPFSWINPCGLQGISMTSLCELVGAEINMQDVIESLCRHMEDVFKVQLRRITPKALSHRLNSKPPWLRTKLANNACFGKTRELVLKSRLHTVCEEALCPNRWKCYSTNTATFLILGDRCTRNCRFCAVEKGKPSPLDLEEPSRVAEAAAKMGLEYVVVTSVTRDDLPDGGAAMFADVIREIRKKLPHARIEVLVPDFRGSSESIRTVVAAHPDVLNHNVETVPRLYVNVRPGADYERSLELLRKTKEIDSTVATKSGLMLGLGEKEGEVEDVLHGLLEAGCDAITLGQYLQPSPAHLKVHRYVRPEEFEYWKNKALAMGFKAVISGPLVRSSYKAKELFQEICAKGALQQAY